MFKLASFLSLLLVAAAASELLPINDKIVDAYCPGPDLFAQRACFSTQGNIRKLIQNADGVKGFFNTGGTKFFVFAPASFEANGMQVTLRTRDNKDCTGVDVVDNNDNGGDGGMGTDWCRGDRRFIPL